MNNEFVLLENITYGNHERQKLDLFIPKKAKSDCGLLLFIHGGGWQAGDKTHHHPDAEYFCKKGYICSTMNYRFVDENINVSDEINDITSALTAIKNECFKEGFSIEKLILSGGSAGAHLSLLFAYTKKENSPVKPVAVCAYCPPVNLKSPDFLMGISGKYENWKYCILSHCCGVKITKESFLCEKQQKALEKISPQSYITESCVPTAVFQGKLDDLVPFEQTENFVRLLGEKGIKNDFLVYENSGHLLDKDPEAAEKSKDIIEKYAEMYF